MIADRVMTDCGSQEIRGDQFGSLVNELVKGMLAIGSGFSPDNRARFGRLPCRHCGQRICHCSPCCPAESRRGSGAYTGHKANDFGLGTKKIIVPDADQCQDHRNIFFKRRFPEMAVHLKGALQQFIKVFVTDEQAMETRWPTTESSGRQPSPRKQTCCLRRCQRLLLFPRWWKLPQNALRNAADLLPVSKNQSRAEKALVMVSWVVKVLEAIIKRVVSGLSFFRVSAMCVPSTLETKWTDNPSWHRASNTRSPSPAQGRIRRCRY